MLTVSCKRHPFFHPDRHGERGSIPVLIAVMIAALVTLMSLRQQLTGLYGGSSVAKSLALKAGGRSNSSGLALLQQLFAQDVIYFNAWGNGTVQYFSSPSSTASWTFQNPGPNGVPQLVYSNCNPRMYGGQVNLELGLGVLPDPTFCSSNLNNPIDLTAHIDIFTPSNGGSYVAGGQNYVNLNAISQVRTAGPSFLPVVNGARSNVPVQAFQPECHMFLDKTDIVQGQPLKITVETSLNVFTAANGNNPGSPVSYIQTLPVGECVTGVNCPSFPITVNGGICANVNGKTVCNVTTVYPEQGRATLFNPQYDTYQAVLYGPGTAGGPPVLCGKQRVRVWPVPQCRLAASPPSITAGQATNVTMTNSNNAFGAGVGNGSPGNPYSPVFYGDIQDLNGGSGTTVMNLNGPNLPPPTTNGGYITRTLYSPGYYWYTGHITGINASTNTCSTMVPVYTTPVCNLTANPSTIYQGDPTWVTLTDNYSGAISGNPISSTAIIDGIYGGRSGLPGWGGSVLFYPGVIGWYPYYGLVQGLGEVYDPFTAGGAAACASNPAYCMKTCATTVHVLPPPCNFTQKSYYQVVGDAGGNLRPFGIYIQGLPAGTYGSPGGNISGDISYPNTGGYPGAVGDQNLYGYASIQVYQLRTNDHSFDVNGCPGGAECWMNSWGYDANPGNNDPNNMSGVYFNGDPNFDNTIWHCSNCMVAAIQSYGQVGCYLDPGTYAFRTDGCFSPETKIRMWDGSAKRADEVRRGDLLLNPVRSKPNKVTRVVAGPEKLALIELGYDGRLVHVTTKHPIPTEHGVIPARLVTRRDSILGSDGRYHPLTVVRKLPVKKDQQVWNFEVESDSLDPMDHMVLADGVVTGDLNLQQRLEKTLAKHPATP